MVCFWLVIRLRFGEQGVKTAPVFQVGHYIYHVQGHCIACGALAR